MASDHKEFERAALAQIRRDTSNPYARIRSIAEDAQYVERIRQHYSEYPIVANLRCGAWYTNATDLIFSHFKSADGHYNGWAFNLRRPNLHIIPALLNAHGALVVDSTRSGKQIPDSFSKTVPIWCCVVNRAVRMRYSSIGDGWDEELYCPPQCVSKQEHSEIMSRVPSWASELASSTYELPLLPKPLRPIWLTPSTSILPQFRGDTPFIPVICLTASKQVENGLERRMFGFSYVQGAGDDHESWSLGLTPEMFWMNRDKLLSCSEDDFPKILSRIVSESATPKSWASGITLITPIAVGKVGGLIAIAKVRANFPAAISDSGMSADLKDSFANGACILINKVSKAEADGEGHDGRILEGDGELSRVLILKVASDKKGGENSFKGSILRCMEFTGLHLQQRRPICIACGTGADLSVGIAVAALQLFFNDSGTLDFSRESKMTVTKASLRTRLHWIIASNPNANPSRATLKRINEYFMSSQNTWD